MTPAGKAERVCVPQAGQQQVCPMFGHHQGLGLGKVEHLSGGMVHGHHLAQGRAASGADLREMVDPGVGRFRPAERLAGMTRLAAGLPARSFTQAADADQLLQPVAGWRPATVGAVQPKPALQFGNASLLRQKQRDEVVSRKLAEGGVIHRPLGIGNPPQCQPECQPLSPATHEYPPPDQADRLGKPDTGTWAVTKRFQ